MALTLHQAIKVTSEAVGNKAFTVKFVFQGNTAAVLVSKSPAYASSAEIIDNTVGSEHWITEPSDLFRFDKNGALDTLLLSVPTHNILFEGSIETLAGKYIHLNLQEKLPFVITPARHRFFDHITRSLVCFQQEEIKKDDRFAAIPLVKDINLLFLNGDYAGYMVVSPLRYITDAIDGPIDEVTPVTSEEYDILREYLSIMSDDQLDKMDGDMELVVTQLLEKIEPRLDRIKSDFRRSVFANSLKELKDYYL